MATKRDFENTARVLSSELTDVKRQFALNKISIDSCQDKVAQIGIIAKRMADVYGNDNPRFDRDRFMKACGF